MRSLALLFVVFTFVSFASLLGRRNRTGRRRHPHLRSRTPLYGTDVYYYGRPPRRGDTVSPLIVGLASTLIFRLGGTLLLAYVFDLGLPGVWIATAVDWAVRSVGLGIFFARGAWKRLHEQEKLRFG